MAAAAAAAIPGMARKRQPLSKRITAVLLCKGDLSDESFESEPCSTIDLFRLASYRHKTYFVVGLVMTAITGLLMPVNQILSGSIADEYLKKPLAEGDEAVLDAVLQIVYVYAITTGIQFIFNFVQQYLLLTVTDEVVGRLRREYVSAVLRLDAKSLDETSPGKLLSQLNENIEKIRDGLGEKFALVLRSVCVFVFSVGAALVYNWKVAVVLLPLGPIGTIVTGLTGRFSARALHQQVVTAARGAALVEETIMNVKTVAACNGQQDMVKKYRSILNEQTSLGARISFMTGFFEGGLFFVIYFFAGLSILVAVPDTFTSGGFSAGSVIISFGSVLLGGYYVGLLGPHLMTVLKARISAAIIYDTIDRASQLDTPIVTDELPQRLVGDIEFRDVFFKYPTREAMVLQGITWRASAGQAIALAGHSGCGKSTSIGLLTKLYEKSSGEILIDGRSISEYDRSALRKNIGLVSQEPALFNGTIRENILLGREWNGDGTTEQRLLKVATIAQAAPFIIKLPMGFETLLGEGGIALSGGQKQRIAIARAIFTDPALLILDEATSALDVQSEKLVQAALHEASIGRTTITIAHRLSTLKQMDVIYVVDKGVVIEEGTHEGLLASKGTYATMAEKQNLQMEDKQSSDGGESPPPIPKQRTGGSLRMSQRAQPADLVDYKEEEGKTPTRTSSFLRLYTHGHLTSIVPALLFSIARGYEIPLYVIMMDLIYDALKSPSDDALKLACSFTVGIGAYVWVVNSLAHYFSATASESVLATIKERVLQRVLHRDAVYFDRPETSNATIVSDINQQQGALIAGLDGRAVLFIWCSNTLVVCNVYALYVCWQMGVIVVTLTVVVFLLIFFLFFLLTTITERQARSDRSPELALEVFSQARAIQIMCVEGHFQGKYTTCQEETRCVQRTGVIIQSIIWSLSNGSIYLFGLVAFGVGAFLVFDGLLTGQQLYLVGLTVEFCAYALGFMLPTFPDLVRANAAARILYAYFDLPDAVDDGDTTTQLTGSLTVRNVSFAYENRRNHKVAKALSISALKGDSIALVGPSGCGKSTLISLIERFYVQQQGIIKLDDVDHRLLSLRHLRTQIALVGQEPVLFQGSIAENIALGCPSATEEDVREACRMASAAAFIEALPEGYSTDVGCKGRALSGGQKQRIAIARALVRKPKLLLLDEATSALDGESERVVQEAIGRASAGRTSISIAHRLASIKHATRIYFIDDGAVVESGSHDELLRINGKYAAFVHAQSI